MIIAVRFALILCAIWDPRRTETKVVMQPKLSGLDLTIIKDRLGKNTAVSSFAFRLPLCKLAASAASLTRHEIISILDIQTLSETKTCYTGLFPVISALLETDLTMLNKIYLNYTSGISDNFIVDAKTYGVTVSKIGYDFPKEAVDYVNNEFSSKTYMRIRDVLDMNDIDKHSSIVIVNGFHYKGTWENVFSSPTVIHKQFHIGQKTLQLEMMQTMTQCSFLDDPGALYKVISFHLSQHDVYMTFVLPYANSSIAELLDTISRTPNFLEDVNSRTMWKFVDIQLPKFKIKTCLDWTPYLKQVGLNLTLDKNSRELNGILNNEDTTNNMYLSKAKQKLFIEIDEGHPSHNLMTHFEVPLVRAEISRDMLPPIPLEQFAVDGPFYFSVSMILRPTMVQRELRRFQLFSGVYYGPEG